MDAVRIWIVKCQWNVVESTNPYQCSERIGTNQHHNTTPYIPIDTLDTLLKINMEHNREGLVQMTFG